MHKSPRVDEIQKWFGGKERALGKGENDERYQSTWESQRKI